jgi:hypothetical protein
MHSVLYEECHYTECRYAECRGAPAQVSVHFQLMICILQLLSMENNLDGSHRHGIKQGTLTEGEGTVRLTSSLS